MKEIWSIYKYYRQQPGDIRMEVKFYLPLLMKKRDSVNSEIFAALQVGKFVCFLIHGD
jgi:hypothetical protein